MWRVILPCAVYDPSGASDSHNHNDHIDNVKSLFGPKVAVCSWARRYPYTVYSNNMNLSTVHHVKNMSEQFFWDLNFTLIYTPDGEWQKQLAGLIKRDLHLDGIKYVSRKKFDSYLKKNNIFCGIRFNTSSHRLPKHLNYSLVFPAYIRSEKPKLIQITSRRTCSGGPGRTILDSIKNSEVGMFIIPKASCPCRTQYSKCTQRCSTINITKRNSWILSLQSFPSTWKKCLTRSIQMSYRSYDLIRSGSKWYSLFHTCYPPCIWLMWVLFWFLVYSAEELPNFQFISKEYESMNHVFLRGYGVNYNLHWIAHVLVAFLRLQVLNCLVIAATKVSFRVLNLKVFDNDSVRRI